MIIESEKDVTKAVLSEYARIKDPRLREIMTAFIRHLHEFAREVKLTEEEFHAAMAYIVALGKHTNETTTKPC
jgi:hydroxyquinol 1,2-dioxygenase